MTKKADWPDQLFRTRPDTFQLDRVVWHRWFAWHRVALETESSFDALVWPDPRVRVWLCWVDRGRIWGGVGRGFEWVYRWPGARTWLDKYTADDRPGAA